MDYIKFRVWNMEGTKWRWGSLLNMTVSIVRIDPQMLYSYCHTSVTRQASARGLAPANTPTFFPLSGSTGQEGYRRLSVEQWWKHKFPYNCIISSNVFSSGLSVGSDSFEPILVFRTCEYGACFMVVGFIVNMATYLLVIIWIRCGIKEFCCEVLLWSSSL